MGKGEKLIVVCVCVERGLHLFQNQQKVLAELRVRFDSQSAVVPGIVEVVENKT